MFINRKKHKPCFACNGVGKTFEPETLCKRCGGYGSIALKVLADRRADAEYSVDAEAAHERRQLGSYGP